MTPLMARALAGLPAGAVPDSILDALSAATRRIAADSLAAVGALQQLTAALDAAGIPSLAWKGPALALQAWGDPAARTFSDLDVVVSPAHRVRARDVARSLGWRSRYAMSAAQEAAIFGGLAAWELERATAPELLELHWAFSALRYPGRLPVAEVLARAVSLRVGGLSVRVPEPADTLALLAQHATKHGWSTLEDVATFTAIAAREPAAVRTAFRRARAVDGGRAFLLACALAARTFGGEPPDEIVDEIRRDRALLRLMAQVGERWESGTTVWRPPLAWDVAWTPGIGARTRLMARALFDPTLREWHAVHLPDPLVALYPLLRPLRLVLQAIGRTRSS